MHIPVLTEEVLHFLKPQRNENFIDCTAGEGGHTTAILEKNIPQGKVLAMEWDKFLFSKLKERETERMIPVNESYVMLEDTVTSLGFGPVSGVLFDLGFSSFHIEESGRGFSFMRDEPLDMRYNEDTLLTAREIVNNYNPKNIKEILEKWGEEDYAEKIAEKIVISREEAPIERTLELVSIIESAIPHTYRKGRINCATKTFQALRIAVNGEIVNLKEALRQSLNVLEKEGRVAVISFHGVEDDETVKFFKNNSQRLNMITPKAITPKYGEIKRNIRSRSAKLRVAIKKQ